MIKPYGGLAYGCLSRDCWTLVGEHCSLETKMKLATTCIKLRNHFYQQYALPEKLELVRASVHFSGYHSMGIAAQNNYRDLIDFFFKNEVTDWTLNWGLEGAAEGGHRNLVDFFISKGAHYWNWGIAGAARGGHRDLVDYFIIKGEGEGTVTDWSEGLQGARRGGHHKLISFFEQKMNESE